MRAFSACLARRRLEAGYRSAYRFYHGNGGRRHFPFTYVHYMRIERGLKLPRPEWMDRFLSALRLTPGEAGCRELYLAYLKDMLKTPESFELILSPLLCRHAEPSSPPGADAMRWMKAEHSFHLTPEQFAVLASDEATYWCSEALFNDRGSAAAEEIAAAFDLPVKNVRAGLKKLKGAGMARESSPGRFKSRWEGKFYTFPGRVAGMEPALKAIEGFWENMYKKRGASVGERVELVRAEGGSVRNYLAVLSSALDSANSYATQTKGDNTGLYQIEARIRRLVPY